MWEKISVTASVLFALSAASSATASVTIGQLAPVNSPAFCTSAQDRFHETVPSGNSYVVPGTGTITSWSHNAAAGANQQLTMKVFRKIADPSTYLVVARDRRPIAESITNTFATNVSVRPGDVLGSNGASAGPTACSVAANPAFPRLQRDGDLLEGEFGIFESQTGNRQNISAVFVPTNVFTLGRTSRNKKKGTATLTVNVPNPGELALAGRGVKSPTAGGAVIARTVPAPGDVELLIKAKGKKKRKLNRTGKVRLTPTITYTPTNGDPATQSLTVKLKKK